MSPESCDLSVCAKDQNVAIIGDLTLIISSTKISQENKRTVTINQSLAAK